MEQDINRYKGALKIAATKIEELSNKLKEKNSNEDIAIIGYACRFPGGANNADEFWSNLINKVDAVTEIRNDRFDYSNYYSHDVDEIGKTNTKNGAFLNVPIDEFDNRHFEVSPVEAEAMDPQQRLLLEVSWEALENAGLSIDKMKGSNTGVFIGMGPSEYLRAQMFSGDESRITTHSVTGVAPGAASGRLSYFYDFKGPAVTCDTACSSSLVALNAAVDSLRRGECNTAIVGGVNLILTPASYVGLSKIHSLASDGRCKTFDENADGFGRGEGCGVIVLRRMDYAKLCGDTISAVVKSVSIAQDGRTNGIAAPNAVSQKKVITQALKQSQINIEDIDYIETHGTGTPLGDVIEVQALNDVFQGRHKKLLIGAVKSNIAHLEAASAMAGIIKIILSLKNEKIPPNINITKHNSKIDWSTVEVVDKEVEWKRINRPRRAGISAFGFTGTVAHAIIEEAPVNEVDKRESKLPYNIMTLSCKNANSMDSTIESMKDFILNSDKDINDICYSTNICKSSLEHKFAITGKDKSEILYKLDNFKDLEDVISKDSFRINNIAFLFTGQGSIYTGIAKRFYETSVVFREALDKCNEKFKEILNISIVDAIYKNSDEKLLENAIYSQPIIFSVQYAITKMWDSLGVKAKTVIGHSIGEYAAACYSGILNLDDAISMIAHRSILMDSIDIDGKMVGVLTNVEVVKNAIKESGCSNVSIAAINAPENVTLSGLSSEVDKVIEKIQEKQRVFIDKLNISHPFHSMLMKEYTDRYYEAIKDIKLSKNKVDIISSITGKLNSNNEMQNLEYWTNHLCNTVNFSEAIEEAIGNDINVFIEIGGNATLTGLANQSISSDEYLFLPSLRKGINEYQQFLESVSKLYLNKVEIDWRSFYKCYKTEKVDLPTYKFNKKRFWIDFSRDVSKVEAEIALDRSDKSDRSDRSKLIDTEKFIKSKNITDMSASEEIICELDINDVEHQVKDIVRILTGLKIDEINNNDDLFTLGFDSLLLLNLKKRIDDKYNISISMNDFFLELNNVSKIAKYIKENAKPVQKKIVTKSNLVTENKYNESSFEGIISSINSELNELLQLHLKGSKNGINSENKPDNLPKPSNNLTPFKKDEFTEEQKKFVDEFIVKYNNKTKKSKEYIENYKNSFADWINSVNYRDSLKEIIYPIVSKKSQGSRFWDIDDNEYIDLGIGYGVHYFGHNPKFITDALIKQINNGIELGPQCELAGKVAALIRELTGVERVTFCNTGSEAVMLAIRIARAVSGKDKIVKFAGSYHGTFDGVLTEMDGDTPYPTSLGSTYGAVKDTLSLIYGSDESLEYIKEHKDEIGAILVEPVQSRRPGFQPKDFLLKLRKLTEELGIILIFDEMVNGFRIQSGGAQAYFGIKADIVTYGKIVGGGLPIGVVAGKSKYMDLVDGGSWVFGDKSRPKDNAVMFAGTFCKNPLSMAAAYAVLTHLKENGDKLQERLNNLTKEFAEEINKFFMEEKVPIRVKYFGSQFKFDSFGRYDLSISPIEMDLFFYLLNYKGVYTWERRTCCFCTEINNRDIRIIINKIKECIYELRNGGFDFKDEINEKSSRNKVFPMSLNQKRLFSKILIDENDPFNIVGALEIKGNVNVEKLENVFNKIISRHETLRTKLYIKDDEFVQEVVDNVDFKIEVIEEYEANDLDELLSKKVTRFDLSKGNLIKITLIKLLNNRNILLINLHHTIADGRSLDLLCNEIINIYSGEDEGIIDGQYSEYVKWEEAYLKSDEIKLEEKYWTEKMSGDVEKLNLPTDKNLKINESSNGRTINMKIDSELVDKVKRISRESGSSLFMTLLSSFNILLSKLSNSEDILIATPVTNRAGEKFDKNIGMFTNTIILRNLVSKNETFEELLKQVKINSLEAYSNMNYPFNFIMDKLNLESIDDRNSFVNVMFVYENMDNRVINLDGLEIKNYDYKSNVSEFDFMMEILEQNGEFNINLTFKKNLFEDETILTWGKYFNKILKVIAENKKILISDIELVEDDDSKKIIEEFNNNITEYPKNNIKSLFEEQVKKTPNDVAVVFNSRKLTYKELDEKSDALAMTLIEKGVKLENVVGIVSEPSCEMIIGILGILKAGAAYLPINLEQPESRIKYILEDSNTKIILSKNTKLDNLSEQYEILDLNDETNYKLGNKPDVNGVNGESLAYIMYTSGTTGMPKGVEIVQKSIVRLVKNTNYISFNSDDKILQTGSLSFDASTFEIWGALLNGLELHLVDKDVILSGFKLQKYIDKNKIRIMWLTSALFNKLVDENIKLFRNLRCLLVGGDVVSSRNVNLVIKECNNIQIINGYGPTENTTFSTCYLINDRVDENKSLPIGRPISNSRAYILDDNKSILPIGVVGELYVSGDGLARGYLNNEELTNEKFIDNPYETGNKMYKTGDLAKWLPDGNIEFIGRKDHQVKIRGFRIEISEVENAIQKIDDIKETIVIYKEDEGSKFLVAYYVSDKEFTVTKLREELKKVLPDYMIPAHFIWLEEMPLTQNGKVDRKALPELMGDVKLGNEYEAPINEIEEKICQIYSEILKVNKVGRNDNFFELGGDSLNATILVEKISNELDCKLSIKEFLKAENIKELSNLISNGTRTKYERIQKENEREYYKASSAQKRIYLSHIMYKDNTTYNMLKAIEFNGKFDRKRFEDALISLINRQESLRTTFDVVDDEIVQKIRNINEVNFKIENIDFEKEEEIDEKIENFMRPFDLKNGPLIRVGIIEVNKEKNIIIFDMHHIISDGFSISILTDELSKLYAGKKLKPLEIQYRDYAAWQLNRQYEDSYKKQEEYWCNKLNNKMPVEKLANSYTNIDSNNRRIETIYFNLEDEVVERLRQIANNKKTTIYMVLLSELNILLSLYHNKENVIVGTPISGRIHKDVENIIGMFVNTLAISSDVDRSKSFGDYLQVVKETVLEAYENQEYPIEELVHKLGVKADVGENCMFDMVFSFQNMNDSYFDIEGLKIDFCNHVEKRGQFNMSIACDEIKDKLLFNICYLSDVYERDYIERFIEHFKNIIKSTVNNEEIVIEDISLITDSELEGFFEKSDFNNIEEENYEFNF